MIKPGLVSVTFRDLNPAAIITLACQGGLQGIEWGGDVHVPHGNLARAREVRRQTQEAGLEVAAYGSYYKVGYSEQAPLSPELNERLEFNRVLETAVSLNAPSIRVWAGVRSSAEASCEDRRRVEQDAVRIASAARSAGLTVTYEYHSDTLMDNAFSALNLLRETAGAGMNTLWQPLPEDDAERQITSLHSVLPWVENLHVYHWLSGVRRPLHEGADSWRQFLQAVSNTGRDHWALLEFVPEDSPEIFLDEARTLKRWLGQ